MIKPLANSELPRETVTSDPLSRSFVWNEDARLCTVGICYFTNPLKPGMLSACTNRAYQAWGWGSDVWLNFLPVKNKTILLQRFNDTLAWWRLPKCHWINPLTALWEVQPSITSCLIGYHTSTIYKAILESLLLSVLLRVHSLSNNASSNEREIFFPV